MKMEKRSASNRKTDLKTFLRNAIDRNEAGIFKGDLGALLRRDYAGSLGRLFTEREIGALFADFRKAFPSLGVIPQANIGTRFLFSSARRLGIKLIAAPDPLFSLRGFYVRKNPELKKPVIFLNTAHHPVAVAASFWHEIGHHIALSRCLSGEHWHPRPVRGFGHDYSGHLNDPHELMADMAVALAAYPGDTARGLFAAGNGGAVELPLAAGRAFAHLRRFSGLRLSENGFGASENLHYLAGFLHYVKLRTALLELFGL